MDTLQNVGNIDFLIRSAAFSLVFVIFLSKHPLLAILIDRLLCQINQWSVPVQTFLCSLDTQHFFEWLYNLVDFTSYYMGTKHLQNFYPCQETSTNKLFKSVTARQIVFFYKKCYQGNLLRDVFLRYFVLVYYKKLNSLSVVGEVIMKKM